MSATENTLRQNMHALYSDHHGWLQNWLRRRLGCSQNAADLAHDTFVRILTSPAAASEEAGGIRVREPRAYLATIARYLLINHLRRQSLERAYLDVLARLPELEAPSPEHQMLILEALQEVDAMLDGLPAKVRAVFVMSQIEGLTYAEIAAQMGIGLRSVKRYMAQALTECILLTP